MHWSCKFVCSRRVPVVSLLSARAALLVEKRQFQHSGPSSGQSPWLPCFGHIISSTGPSVSPFRDFSMAWLIFLFPFFLANVFFSFLLFFFFRPIISSFFLCWSSWLILGTSPLITKPDVTILSHSPKLDTSYLFLQWTGMWQYQFGKSKSSLQFGNVTVWV